MFGDITKCKIFSVETVCHQRVLMPTEINVRLKSEEASKSLLRDETFIKTG